MPGSSAVSRSEIVASSNPRRSRAALRACPPAHRRRFGAIQGDESNFSLRKLARVRESARGWVAAKRPGLCPVLLGYVASGRSQPRKPQSVPHLSGSELFKTRRRVESSRSDATRPSGSGDKLPPVPFGPSNPRGIAGFVPSSRPHVLVVSARNDKSRRPLRTDDPGEIGVNRFDIDIRVEHIRAPSFQQCIVLRLGQGGNLATAAIAEDGQRHVQCACARTWSFPGNNRSRERRAFEYVRVATGQGTGRSQNCLDGIVIV